MDKDFIVVIPARLESSRLEKKLLKEINGKSIIERTWNKCLESQAKEVVVATDSTEIYDLIINLGGECFLSKEIHESGTDRIHEYVTSSLVAEDALIINVQADEPLIDINSINGLAAFMASNNYEYATLCKKFGEGEDLNDPNKVKVVFDGKGKALYFSRSKMLSNTKEGTSYHHIGVYGYTARFLKEFAAAEQSQLEKSEKLEQLRALENDLPIHVLEVAEYDAWGIDTPEDLEKFRKHIEEIES